MKTGIWKCLVLLILVSAGSKAQEIKPYLQSPSPTSVWITWKTESNTESVVIYGEDSLNLLHSDTGNCQILSDAGYDSNYYYHDVKLTGLEPGHYYYYRTMTGSLASSVYRFRTQPPAGQNPGIYRFLILGDHQIKNSDRYERLMKAAREKITEKYGGKVEDNINLIINDGDQVNEGTLDQYEHVHFQPSSILSGNIPIMTTVGNHETYGSIGLPLYYKHFFYNDLGYKGIVSPGGENYYSYQEKNIVFIHLSSEHQVNEQVNWIQQIIDSVRADTAVDWVISVAHRPIQAEQYVGDISVYIRDKIIPILAQTEKSVLHITGHHHLYARGQLRDFPMYHIISGAASWDQYWGQSTEMDFDDEQKTIDYWTYQIATFDNDKHEMKVESYAIGSPKLGFTLDNILIDSFYRKKDVLPPDKPFLLPITGDTITLPYTFVSSPYSAGTGEPYNSVQFQVSSTEGFSKTRIDLIRDFENLYGTTGNPDYMPVDINMNVDIFKFEIAANRLTNGTYFIRTRHRDKNIMWSSWSDPLRFIIKESAAAPVLSLNHAGYDVDEDIQIEYSQAPGLSLDWIGIYRLSDVPGQISSTRWSYTSGIQGNLIFQGLPAGYYFVTYFLEDGYTEASDRIIFSVGSDLASVTVEDTIYQTGQPVAVNFEHGPGTPADWIGIIRRNAPPGTAPLVDRQYISNLQAGTVSFDMVLAPGEYYASLFINNSSVRISNKAFFTVESNASGVDQNPGESSFKVFPSPTTGRFKIRTFNVEGSTLSLKITSMDGALVLDRQFDISPANDSEEIDLTGKPRGIYNLFLQAGNRQRTLKLVLQ